jgi:hypothetical protein
MLGAICLGFVGILLSVSAMKCIDIRIKEVKTKWKVQFISTLFVGVAGKSYFMIKIKLAKNHAKALVSLEATSRHASVFMIRKLRVVTELSFLR